MQNMNDLDKEYIKELFYQQIRNLSVKKANAFDYQFSASWG